MKKSFPILISSILFIVTCIGCTQISTNTNMPATENDFSSSDDHAAQTDSYDGTNVIRPPDTTTNLQTFENIREMKDELQQNATSSSSIAASHSALSFRELIGLNSNYTESWVEWAGGEDYFIYYTSSSSVIAFMPFGSEDRLRQAMNERLADNGTYEELSRNPLIISIQKNEIPTSLGSSYECIYSNSSITDSKLRYHDYTDNESGIQYILSESFSPSGELRSMALFVFDDENSFMCSGTSPDISMLAAIELRSQIVE